MKAFLGCVLQECREATVPDTGNAALISAEILDFGLCACVRGY